MTQKLEDLDCRDQLDSKILSEKVKLLLTQCPTSDNQSTNTNYAPLMTVVLMHLYKFALSQACNGISCGFSLEVAYRQCI